MSDAAQATEPRPSDPGPPDSGPPAPPPNEAGRGMPGTPGTSATDLVARARVHLDRGEYVPAQILAARALAEPDGDRPARARALSIQARCAQMLSEHRDGMEAALQAIDLWHSLGNTAEEALAHTTIARILNWNGDTTGALDESLEALALAEQGGDPRSVAIAMVTLAATYIGLRQFEVAVSYCERAGDLAQVAGDELTRSNALDTAAVAYGNMADAARADGDPDRARALAESAIPLSEQALQIARRAGHRAYQAVAIGNLAEAMVFVGRAMDALALLESWQPDPQRDISYNVQHHLETRGRIHMELGQYPEAIELFTGALRLDVGKPFTVTTAEYLAEAHERAGDLPAALDAYKRFHALFVECSSEAAQRSAQIASVRLETARAKADAAQERARAVSLHNANLELSRRAESLLRESHHDPLTGLANRRVMDRVLGTDRRHSIALIDVDSFKLVNDVFSHPVGDEVLRTLAGLLRTSCRPGDVPVRYGGEEFAVLLADVTPAEATAAAERIRHAIGTADWSRIASGLAVTVSIGVAAGVEAPGPTGVIALADARLYQAKNTGRNRVVGPPGTAPAWA